VSETPTLAGTQMTLQDPIIDGLLKGWPAIGRRASELRAGELTIEDLPTPALLLDNDALDANIAALAAWCEAREILLAPHAKTTLAPAILRRQLAAGAWGLTVADARQARVALASGAQNVLIANEILNIHDMEWLCAWSHGGADVAPLASIWFCIDSIEGLELAESVHRRIGGPRLRVLVELGFQDGRCGVRSERVAAGLASAVAASDHLSLCGIEAYEGLIPDSLERPALSGVDELLERVATLAKRVAPLIESDEPLMTAGGSSYFERVDHLLSAAATELGWRLCIRSGCYVTHDHGLYERLTPRRRDPEAPRFLPALQVSSTVLSRPQRDRLILDCGRRDVSYDSDLPVVIAPAEAAQGLRLVALNDQHAHLLAQPDCLLAPGEQVRLGISHPCTTIERWRLLALVDGRGQVLEAIPTYF
jgi:D-serine deaminase-like pyridoxal phosphate-dependent protein